jgi:hypothetical protein
MLRGREAETFSPATPSILTERTVFGAEPAVEAEEGYSSVSPCWSKRPPVRNRGKAH